MKEKIEWVKAEIAAEKSASGYVKAPGYDRRDDGCVAMVPPATKTIAPAKKRLKKTVKRNPAPKKKFF